MPVTESPTQSSLTSEQQAMVLEEMNSILANPRFSSSKRCDKLFRRLIELALAGDHSNIKERTLGVEVFGRDAGYDTNVDPVVRMAASEVRKRLAQYYQNSECPHPVVIRLRPGSYLLDFLFNTPEPIPSANQESETPEPIPPAVLPAASVVAAKPQPRTASKLWYLAAALVLLALATLWLTRTGLENLRYIRWNLAHDIRSYGQWKPFINSSMPTILCVSDGEPGKASSVSHPSLPDPQHPGLQAPDDAKTDSDQHPMRISYSDARIAHRISTLLADFGQMPYLYTTSNFREAEFQYSPVVFIGSISNPIPMKLLSNLRFSIQSDPKTGDRWIHDAQNPSRRDWLDSGDDKKMEYDYAVIASFLNPETRQWVMILAGLHHYGNEAAGDLMTKTSHTDLVPAQVRQGGNFEMVIRTRILDGMGSGPQVLAVHTW